MSSLEPPAISQCPICLEPPNGSFGVARPCGHTFCFDCISRWSANSDCCPLDRTPIHEVAKVDRTGQIEKVVRVCPKRVSDKMDAIAAHASAYIGAIANCERCWSGYNGNTLLLCSTCLASVIRDNTLPRPHELARAAAVVRAGGSVSLIVNVVDSREN